MITAEIKDEILIALINNGFDEQIIHSKTFNYEYKMIRAVLKQFSNRGLINYRDFSSLRYRVQVEIEAHDFITRGGFKFEEDAFRNNFTKLELELAKLEGEISQERFSNIMTLISAASAAVSAYTSVSPSI